MSEKLSLVERLKHFQQNQIEAGDQYGTEILHHTIAEFTALEAKLQAMGSLVAAARALSNDVHEAFPEGLDKLDGDPKDVAGYAALILKLDAALTAAQEEQRE